LVCDFLIQHFPELLDLKFTARIEDQLDDIANGDAIWHQTVDGFYKEIRKRIEAAGGAESLKKAEISEHDCPTCKKHKLVKRTGKFGDFYGCAGFVEKGKAKCSAMFKIGENGEPVSREKKEVKYLEGKVCDKCGSRLVIRVGIKSGKEFGGCEKFPSCRRMFDLDGYPIEFENKYKKKEEQKEE